MRRLSEIPIHVEGPAARDGLVPGDGLALGGGLGGGVSAILTELASLLERLADAQVRAAIDLRSLPMSSQDRTELQRVLGEGEVKATVHAEGVSTLRETRISGIWWVEHRDAQGELMAELLEVTQVPQILACASDEIAAAARTLREQLSGGAQPQLGRN